MTDKGYPVKDWDLPMASESTDDQCVFEVLQTFGLSQEDLHSLSQYSAEELTVENLPGILQTYMKKKLAQTQISSMDQSTHSTPPASLPTSVQGQQIRKYPSPSPPSILHSRSGHTLKERLDPSASSQPVIRSTFEHINTSGTGQPSSQPSAFVAHSDMGGSSLAHMVDNSFEDARVVDYEHGFSSKERVKEKRFTFSDATKAKLDQFGQTYERKSPVEKPKRINYTQDIAAPLQHNAEKIRVVQSRHREAQKDIVKSQPTRHQTEDSSSCSGTKIIQPQSESTEKFKKTQRGKGVDLNQRIDALRLFLLDQQKLQHSKNIQNKGQQIEGPSVENLEQKQIQNLAIELNPLPQEQMPSVNITHQSMQGSHGFQQHVPICAPPVFESIPPQPVFESFPPPQPVFESFPPPQFFGNIAPPQTNIISGYVGLSQPNPPIHGHLGGGNVYPPFLGYAGPSPPIPPVIVDPSIRNIAPSPFPVYGEPPQVNLPMPATLGFNNVPPYFHGNPSPSPSWPPLFPPPQTINNVYPTFPGTAGPPQTNPTMPPLPTAYPPRMYSIKKTPGVTVTRQWVMKEPNKSFTNLRILTNVSHGLNPYQRKSSSTAETVQAKLETPSVCEAKKTELSADSCGNEVDNKTSDDMPFRQRGYPLFEEMQNYIGDFRHNKTLKCFLCCCSFDNQTELDDHLRNRLHKMNIQIFSIQFRAELNKMNYFRCDTNNMKLTKAVPKRRSADGVKPDRCKHGKDAKPGINVEPPSSVKPVVQDKSVTDNTKPVDTKSTGIVTTATVAKQASGVSGATPVSSTNTNISKAVPAAIENPSFLQRDHPTQGELSNYNGFFPRRNGVFTCHFCMIVCKSSQEMLGHRNIPEHLAHRNAFGKRFAKELLCMRLRRKVDGPPKVVAATIKSADDVEQSAQAAKIKTSQPHALSAKDTAPVQTEGGNILQPEVPATASTESVQTADVKTSDSASKTAPVGAPSKPSDVEPRLVKTVAGAESRNRRPGKVIVQPRHATSKAPGDGHAGDRGDATVTTTSASTNKKRDDDVPGGETKTAEEVERRQSHGCLTRESAVHSLQKGLTAKALGETSNDARAPKENKLMMKRGAAHGEKRGDADQGKNEKPVSKKPKIRAKDTPPPLNRDPIGMEFMLPGFYCKLCWSFFAKEEFVRKHCHKHEHQQNLQKKEPQQRGPKGANTGSGGESHRKS